MQPVVSFVNDSPRVEGRNILVDVQTNYSVRCAIRLAGTKSDLRNCKYIRCMACMYKNSCSYFIFHVPSFTLSIIIYSSIRVPMCEENQSVYKVIHVYNEAKLLNS